MTSARGRGRERGRPGMTSGAGPRRGRALEVGRCRCSRLREEGREAQRAGAPGGTRIPRKVSWGKACDKLVPHVLQGKGDLFSFVRDFLNNFLAVLSISWLHGLFSSWGEPGLLSRCSVQPYHCGGCFCWGGPASEVVTQGPVTPWLVGSIPDQGSNPYLLHW